MNLTFVFDGYFAQTALEDSFDLFVFDGYLIYGEVPPPVHGSSERISRRKKGGTGDRDEERMFQIEREDELLMKALPELLFYLN